MYYEENMKKQFSDADLKRDIIEKEWNSKKIEEKNYFLFDENNTTSDKKNLEKAGIELSKFFNAKDIKDINVLDIMAGNLAASKILYDEISKNIKIKIKEWISTDIVDYRNNKIKDENFKFKQIDAVESVKTYGKGCNILLLVCPHPSSNFADYFACKDFIEQTEKTENKYIVFFGHMGETDGTYGIDYYFENCHDLVLELQKDFTPEFRAGYIDRNLYIYKIEIGPIFTVSIEGSLTNIKTKPCYVDIEIPNTVKIIVKPTDSDENLKSILIPKSVVEIRENAFSDDHYPSLNSVKFDNNSQLKIIGSQAFRYTQIENNIEIPKSVVEIKENAFEGCLKLKSITFEKDSKLTFLGKEAFYILDIESIEIPSNVKIITEGNFNYCSKLKSVSFLNEKTIVHENCFMNCELLNPESIEIINKHKSKKDPKLEDGYKKKYMNNVKSKNISRRKRLNSKSKNRNRRKRINSKSKNRSRRKRVVVKSKKRFVRKQIENNLSNVKRSNRKARSYYISNS